jgi:hypothetical protein
VHAGTAPSFLVLLSSFNTSDEILEFVAVSLILLEELNRTRTTEYSRGYTVPVICQGSRGRPRFDIKPDQLAYSVPKLLKF